MTESPDTTQKPLIYYFGEMFSKYVLLFSCTWKIICYCWTFGHEIKDDPSELKRALLYLFEVCLFAVVLGPSLFYYSDLYFPDDISFAHLIDAPEAIDFWSAELSAISLCLGHVLVGYMTYRGLCLFARKPKLIPTISIFLYWSGFFMIGQAFFTGFPLIIAQIEIYILDCNPYTYENMSDCKELEGFAGLLFTVVDYFLIGIMFVLLFFYLLINSFAGFAWIGQTASIPGPRVFLVYLLSVILLMSIGVGFVHTGKEEFG